MANPEDIFKARIKVSTEHPLVWEVMLLMPGARALTPAQAPPSLPVELRAGMLGPLSLSSHPGVQGWGQALLGAAVLTTALSFPMARHILCALSI